MTDHYDVVVIGAGPAGMAAACVAADGGARTLVLDEQMAPGGQVYRAIERSHPKSGPDFGPSYAKGRPLARRFRQSSADYVPAAGVWLVSAKGEIGYSNGGVSRLLKADQVIIATGAQERPIPVPGWTLPGVMTVGAAQILFKDAGVALENAIFAGTGPLLYAAVHQYLQAGIPIRAVLDLTPRKNYLRAMAHLPKALPSLPKIAEGWLWKQKIALSKVPYVQWVSEIAVSGDQHATGVTYLRRGRRERIDARHVLLHLGVVPNINISRAAGCETAWDEAQLCWRVVTDGWGRSSVPGIFVAGDGGDIGGATAAEQRGTLAALEALRHAGRITTAQRDARSRASRVMLRKEIWARPFLETLFRPAAHLRLPQDRQTVVCRCEEITAGEIERVVDLGCRGPNQVKSYSRCGMGPCQGRFCGLTVSELIARQLNQPVADIGYYRLRPPLKPLPLDELVNLQIGDGVKKGGA
jgi:thioredoxin reductase